jgi:hypothetical protein
MNQGASFRLKGTLKSKYLMTKIQVGFAQAGIGWTAGYPKVKKPNSKTFKIPTIDSSMKFGKLAAGIYYYRMKVWDQNGCSRVINKKFTVKALSRFTLTGVSRPPASLLQGSSFNLMGKIGSNLMITNVDAGILDSSGVNWVPGFKFSIATYTKSFNIALFDPLVKFGKLPAGTYTYAVYATDSNGRQAVVLQKFSVYTIQSGFTFTGVTYPPNYMPRGSSFAVAGSVASNL